MMTEGFVQNATMPHDADIATIDKIFKRLFKHLPMVESGQALLSEWRVMKQIEVGQGKMAVLHLIKGKVGGVNIDMTVLKECACPILP